MVHALFVPGDLAQLADEPIRAVERRAVGQLGVDDEIALVLFGDEAHRHDAKAEDRQTDQPAVHHQGDDCQAQQQADRAPIAGDGAIESPVEAMK